MGTFVNPDNFAFQAALNAITALQQIKNKRYPESILDYTGDVLLVGINYDKTSKEHECIIEKYEKH